MTDPTPSPSRAPDRADAHRERVEIREVLTEAFGPLPTDHIHLVDRLRVHLAERRLAAGAEVEALRAFRDLVEECGPTDELTLDELIEALEDNALHYFRKMARIASSGGPLSGWRFRRASGHLKQCVSTLEALRHLPRNPHASGEKPAG